MSRSVVTAAVVLVGAAMSAPGAVAAPSPRVHGHTGEARACLPLDGGGALIGTGGGLIRIDGAGTTRAVWTASDGLPGTRIDALAMDGDALWIGTDAGAARARLVGDRLTIVQALASKPVRDVARFGAHVYLATWGGGVLRVDARGTVTPVKFTRGGNHARVAALAVAGGTLWVATSDGLHRLTAGKLARVVAGDAAAGIASLHGAGDRLWIAGAGGLHVRTGDRSVGYGGGELRRVTALDDTIVVASMGDGLARVDRGRLTRLSGGPDGLVMAQAAAGGAGGAACAGGLDGVWLRPDRGAGWTRVASAAGPPSNDVSALASDGARLWVGTFDRGLAVRERGGWRVVAHPDLDARVNALVVEPRPGAAARIWIATAAGLMTLDGDDVRRLTRRDGLPGRNVLALARLRDGRIVAGTSGGAVVIGAGGPVRVGPRDIGNVWAIAEDGDGGLWLGTTTGLYRGPSVAHAGKDDAALDPGWQRFSVAGGHLRDDWVTALVGHDRAVFAGTYNGGVTRFALGAADAAIAPTQLGDGWINPGGLRWDGDRLYAATMDGLRSGDGLTATWTTATGLPGKDVTASLRTGGTTWIATRRGLVELTR